MQADVILLQAKEALERRRLERIADDERMRKPWQQPEPPKKPILRAAQKQKPVPVSVRACCSDKPSQTDEGITGSICIHHAPPM